MQSPCNMMNGLKVYDGFIIVYCEEYIKYDVETSGIFMEMLKYDIFGNTIAAWLTALGIGALSFFILAILRKRVLRHVLEFSVKTENKLDDLIAELIGDLKLFMLIALAIYIGSAFVAIQPRVSRLIEITLIVAFLLQCGFWGNRIIVFMIVQFIRKHEPQGGDKKSVPAILQFASRVLLWSLIILLVMDNLGINVTTLLAGLGIGGIAIALALQNILADLFASLSILLDKPFETGDFISVGDFLGTVEHIGLKTTRIRSLSGEQNIFSNTDLLQSRIRNYKRMSERRVVFSFGVIYQTPAEKLRTIPATVREIIESQKQVRFDRAHFKQYGDSSLDFEVVYYVLSPDFNLYMDIQQNINFSLYERFAREQIEFAYPTRTLIMASGNPDKGTPKP
jgi:small-conductance mechanosensitive channel